VLFFIWGSRSKYHPPLARHTGCQHSLPPKVKHPSVYSETRVCVSLAVLWRSPPTFTRHILGDIEGILSSEGAREGDRRLNCFDGVQDMAGIHVLWICEGGMRIPRPLSIYIYIYTQRASLSRRAERLFTFRFRTHASIEVV
jgi:hypothetical protein